MTAHTETEESEESEDEDKVHEIIQQKMKNNQKKKLGISAEAYG